MVRRDFLKLSGLLSAALLVGTNSLGRTMSLPVEAECQGKLYRGTADGKVYISGNAGKTWSLHTNFGPAFVIHDLRSNSRGSLQARLGYSGHSFGLELAQNGITWRTG